MGGISWERQVSGTNNYLYGVCFYDENNGITVGNSGTILRTTDGGASWVNQPSGTINDLFGIHFIDGSNGIAVGSNSTILKTTDAGNNWQNQISGISNHLRGIYYSNVNIATAIGWGGTIIRTTNGGSTWVSQSSGTTNILRSISFTDVNNGMTVGDFGTILRTTDGGNNWESQSSRTNHNLRGISFINENYAITVGYHGAILQTSNGGVPVELTSFTANVKHSGQVVLNWSTATELNNQMFEIERRAENNDYVNIGYIEGHGTTTEQQDYTYVDKTVEEGTYYYRLKQIDFDGTFEYSDVVTVEIGVPDNFYLSQNYPIPFNPSTRIEFTLHEKQLVSLRIYNTLGELVGELVNVVKEAGSYSVIFDASNLPSGVYFYRLQTPGFADNKKMTLLK